jgi:hypothetical protein
MEKYNIELLNETYNRVVKLFKDYSNLNIFLKEIPHDDIFRKSSEIFILYKNDPHSKICFKMDLFNFKVDNIYSFLLNHEFSYHYQYNTCSIFKSCSIFKFAERCRQYYKYYKYYIDPTKSINKVSYELFSSEAGKIIKEFGFPESLEELSIKLALIGY